MKINLDTTPASNYHFIDAEGPGDELESSIK